MVEAKSSYFASIDPRSLSNQVPVATVYLEEEDDSISNGMFTHCFSHTGSEVIRCNHKLLAPSNSEDGGKVWKSIARLGVSFGGNESAGIEKVERME